MKNDFFKTHITRLQVRFGNRAIDNEFIQLAWREVHDMSEAWFARTVDTWIGSRSHNKPPLLSEFREARIAEEKLKFENDLRGATGFLERRAPEEMRKHLRAILIKEFGGVEGIQDALEVARLKQKVRQSNSDDPGAA